MGISFSAVIGLTGLAGAVQAQTVTNAFEVDNIVVAYGENTANDFSAPVTFTVAAPGDSLYIQGTAISSPYISGIGSLVDLTQSSVVYEDIALTNLAVGNPLFATANLQPGTYEFLYAFSDSSQSLPDTVSIAATLTSSATATAPEVDPNSAAAALTLLAGVLLILRGRSRSVPSHA